MPREWPQTFFFDLPAEFQERSLEETWCGARQVMMSGTREKDQPAVCCHLVVEGLSFRRASEAVGIARQDQDRYIAWNSANCLQG